MVKPACATNPRYLPAQPSTSAAAHQALVFYRVNTTKNANKCFGCGFLLRTKHWFIIGINIIKNANKCPKLFRMWLHKGTKLTTLASCRAQNGIIPNDEK